MKLITVVRLRMNATSALCTRLHGLVLMIRADFTILHSSQDAERVMGQKDMKNDVHSTCGRDK